MKIVLTGGGSGGHITPLLALATELKKLAPEVRLVFVGQKGDRFGQMVATHAAVDEAHYINAGKFRRYHGEIWRQFVDFRTMLLNVRDFFRFLAGLSQSWRLLGKLSPDAVFIKGGFVGVPVGLAAARYKIPLVTHDSDAVPGLANRIIARWVSYHTVALPVGEYKSYSSGRVVTVGVPVSGDFKPVRAKEQKEARQKLGFKKITQVLLVTGGGLGARRLNDLMVAVSPELLKKFPRLAVVHLAGHKQSAQVEAAYAAVLEAEELDRVKVLDFTNEMHEISKAADVIITRAGATTIAEFAAQGKACIIVPSASLAGGHQLKNAQRLAEAHATLMVTEGKGAKSELLAAVTTLLGSTSERQELADNLAKLAHPDSARELAELLLGVASEDKNNAKISR